MILFAASLAFVLVVAEVKGALVKRVWSCFTNFVLVPTPGVALLLMTLTVFSSAQSTSGTDPKCGLDCDQSVGRFSITTDNGDTWSKSQVVVPNILGFSVDSVDIEVDNNRLSPYYGGIYVSTTQFGGSAESTITVSRSKD